MMERQPARRIFARHAHDAGYVTVVLEGAYQEVGDQGRYRLAPGDVVFHDPFAAHGDVISSSGAAMLNLPWQGFAPHASGVARCRDPDAVVRAAGGGVVEAIHALQAELEPADPQQLDWPDLLARDLRAAPETGLRAWAEVHGLAAETLSRGFGRAFGMTPRRYRAVSRARRALRALVETDMQLAELAAQLGFADQAHLCRSIQGLTGRAPGAWRRVKSIQDPCPDGRR